MNKNIEVINSHLWAVNYYNLQYIKDITYYDNSPDALNKIASLTSDGIIVLNKDHELWFALKQILLRLMQDDDEGLIAKINYMQDKNSDGYDRFYKFSLNAELKRREIEKEFKQSNKKSKIKVILDSIGFSSKESR